MFFEPSLELHLLTAPGYTGVKNRIVPIFKSRYGLYDLSDSRTYEVSYDILKTPKGLELVEDPSTGIKWFIPKFSGTYFIRANWGKYVAYISVFIQKHIIYPGLEEVYNTYRQELIPDVYSSAINTSSPTYCDDSATCVTLSSAYTMIKSYYEAAFPNIGKSLLWEETLTSFSNIYSDTATDTGKLFKFLHNIQANGSMNPYYFVYYISQYLAFRTGQSYYVYLNEHKSDFSEIWRLGKSALGANTRLSASSDYYSSVTVYIFKGDNPEIPDNVRFEIDWFIKKIIRADISATVNYDSLPGGFNLNTERLVWYTDPGISEYCLRYPLGEEVLESLQPSLQAAYALVDTRSTAYLEKIEFKTPQTAVLISSAKIPLKYQVAPPSNDWSLGQATLGINSKLGGVTDFASEPNVFQNIKYTLVPNSGNTNFIATSSWRLGIIPQSSETYVQYTSGLLEGFTSLNPNSVNGYWGILENAQQNHQQVLNVSASYEGYLDLYSFSADSTIQGDQNIVIEGTYVTPSGTYTAVIEEGLDYKSSDVYNFDIMPGGIISTHNSGTGYIAALLTTRYQTYGAQTLFKIDIQASEILMVAQYNENNTISVNFYDQNNEPFNIDFAGSIVCKSSAGSPLGSSQNIEGLNQINVSVSTSLEKYIYVSLYDNSDGTGEPISISVAEQRPIYNLTFNFQQPDPAYFEDEFRLVATLSEALPAGYDAVFYNPDGSQNNVVNGPSTNLEITLNFDSSGFAVGNTYVLYGKIVEAASQTVVYSEKYSLTYHPPTTVHSEFEPVTDPYASEGYNVKMVMTEGGSPWNIPAGSVVKLYDPTNTVFKTLVGPQTVNYVEAPIPANTLTPSNSYNIKGFVLSAATGAISGYALFSFSYDPPSALTPTVSFSQYDDGDVLLNVSYSENIPTGFISYVYNPDNSVNNKVEGPQDYNSYTATIDKSYLTFAQSYTITVKIVRTSDGAIFGETYFTFNYFPPKLTEE